MIQTESLKIYSDRQSRAQTRSQRLSWDHINSLEAGLSKKELEPMPVSVQTYNTILKLILSVNSGSKSDPVSYRVGSSAETLEEY